MALALNPTDFLSSSDPLLDVRSPGEYESGHIPGAINFPLFSNDERAQVGLCYKQHGRDEAVEVGLAIAGPKLGQFVTKAKALAPDRTVRVHCWRGGMRSGSMAWLLETAGFQVVTLAGGYKSFRRWAQAYCAESHRFIVVGGMTGTGKTDILHAIAQRGGNVLDLERLANHRGSSYGALGLDPQPSNEHFENEIAMQLWQCDRDRPIWVEGESRRIGLCRVPDSLFNQMLAAPMLEVVRSRAERVAILVEVYRVASREDLALATERLRKRLGGQRTQAAIAHIQAGQLPEACDIILDYYDRTYDYALNRYTGARQQLDITGNTAAECAAKLLDHPAISTQP
jgi:tRNA 2-selenouridine synthase